MRVHRAGWSGAHDPRRRVRGVAHGGVRRPVGDADLGREDVPAGHPELQRQWQAGIRHPPQRTQHRALVVGAGAGHPRAEEELAAVGVEVGRQQRDALGVEGRLDRAHQLVQQLGEGLRARLRENLVRAREPHEGDGRDPVLGVGGAGREVLAQGHREERRQAVLAVGRGGCRPARCRVRLPAAQQQGTVVARAGRPGRQPGRGRRADDDLAGLGGLLGGGHGTRAGAEHEQLAGGGADEEELDVAGVHAHRHRQGEPARRRGHGGRGAQRGPHLDGGVAGLLGVVLAPEEEEQGVAAELQQLAAAGCRDGEHRPEHPVERLDDLLGADPALPGEPLGECGEPRDVREHQGAVDGAVQCAGDLVVPDQRQGRDVATQVGHRSCSRWAGRRGVVGIARLPHAHSVEQADPPFPGAQGGPVRVDFLGVRGSVCAPGPDFVRYGGNTSCLAVRTDARRGARAPARRGHRHPHRRPRCSGARPFAAPSW